MVRSTQFENTKLNLDITTLTELSEDSYDSLRVATGTFQSLTLNIEQIHQDRHYMHEQSPKAPSSKK